MQGKGRYQQEGYQRNQPKTVTSLTATHNAQLEAQDIKETGVVLSNIDFVKKSDRIPAIVTLDMTKEITYTPDVSD